MKDSEGYRKFQDVIFQEIQDRQRQATQTAVEEFARYAETKGFTLDRLVEMAQSGMSGADLWSAVHGAKN